MHEAKDSETVGRVNEAPKLAGVLALEQAREIAASVSAQDGIADMTRAGQNDNAPLVQGALRAVVVGATGELAARHVISRLVQLAEAIAFQAGVGSVETAGGIVSYLAAHPEHMPALMDGSLSVLDWPERWHVHGCLTWHGQDGKIYSPEQVRATLASLGSMSDGLHDEGSEWAEYAKRLHVGIREKLDTVQAEHGDAVTAMLDLARTPPTTSSTPDERARLIERLQAWPARPYRELTCSIESLMKQAATALEASSAVEARLVAALQFYASEWERPGGYGSDKGQRAREALALLTPPLAQEDGR